MFQQQKGREKITDEYRAERSALEAAFNDLKKQGVEAGDTFPAPLEEMKGAESTNTEVEDPEVQ